MLLDIAVYLLLLVVMLEVQHRGSLSKVFESILNKKILKHLSLHNLPSDRQYGFRQGRSTGDLLAFLTESWSSSFRNFGETFAVALDISKAFDRVWHKAYISKLSSYPLSFSLQLHLKFPF